MGGREEPGTYGIGQETDQTVEVSVAIADPNWLVVIPELRQLNGLEELLESAETTGQGHEALRQFCHASLTLVHRRHDVQFSEVAVPQFAARECLRNHADGFAPGGKHAIGNASH